MIRRGTKKWASHLLRKAMLPALALLACTSAQAQDRVAAFRDADVNDQELRSLIARTRLVPWDTPQPTPIASRVTLTMRDGRVRSAEVADFKGTPDNPLNANELRDKVLLLTRDYDVAAMTSMFDRLRKIEDETNLDWLYV